MLAVFLDESGIFEKKENEVPLNAGLVYKGPDLERSIQELNSLLHRICTDHGLCFPDGLHGSQIRDRSTRRKIQSELLEFLAERQEWMVVALVGGSFSYDMRSNIIDERVASNLYLNMLMRLLENVIIYSKLTEGESEACLEIASRVSRVPQNDHIARGEYQNLGYEFSSLHEGAFYYPLIDEPILSAALNRIYQGREPSPALSFSFKVQSIYKAKNIGLMAADLVCNWLHGLSNPQSHRGSAKMHRVLTRLGVSNYIWMYDRVDQLWRELVDLNGTDFSFWERHLEFYLDQGDAASYYRKRWPLQHLPLENSSIARVLEQAEVLMASPDVEYAKMVSVLEHMLGVFSSSGRVLDPEIEYQLNQLLMRLFRRQGRAPEAANRGSKALQLLDSLPSTQERLERRFSTLLQMGAAEHRRFNFARSLEILSLDVLNPLQEWQTQSEKLFGPLVNPLLGKACGTLGKSYAFLGQYPEAQKYLEQAWGQFEGFPPLREGAAALMLQLAFSMNDRSLFGRFVPSYFAGLPQESSPNQDILGDGAIGREVLHGENPERVLILLKYLNTWPDPCHEELASMLISHDYQSRFKGFQVPFRIMLFRHLAEISFKHHDNRRGKHFIKMADQIGTANSPLWEMLSLGNRMLEANYCCPRREWSSVYKALYGRIAAICKPEEYWTIYHPDRTDSWFWPVFNGPENEDDKKDRINAFIQRFTYIYR